MTSGIPCGGLHLGSGYEGTAPTKSLSRDYAGKRCRDVMGLYRGWRLVASCRFGGAQALDRVKSAPTGHEANTSCQGLVARETASLTPETCKLQEEGLVEQGETVMTGGGGTEWRDGIRARALLLDLVSGNGKWGAARVLGSTPRTTASCMRTGRLSELRPSGGGGCAAS